MARKKRRNRGSRSVRSTAKAYKRAGFQREDIAEMRRSYKRKKKNPARRKGKTNRWISGKAFRVLRRNGKTIVEVKR